MMLFDNAKVQNAHAVQEPAEDFAFISILGTLSGPCVTTDILKLAIDNENHTRIDVSKEFSRMKR
jgi:hypothetical protein